MSEEEAYQRGLEKLGLYGSWNKGVSLQGIPYETSPIDLRTDPAFAWRVWSAYIAWVCEHAEPGPRDAMAGELWEAWFHRCEQPAVALHAAVCELGREP